MAHIYYGNNQILDNLESYENAIVEYRKNLQLKSDLIKRIYPKAFSTHGTMLVYVLIIAITVASRNFIDFSSLMIMIGVEFLLFFVFLGIAKRLFIHQMKHDENGYVFDEIKKYRRYIHQANADGKIDIYKSGLEGELKMLDIYSSFPDEFNVFYSVDVMDIDEPERKSQIDFLIVSPYGIFVNEIKNISGSISGDGKANELYRLKEDNWGNYFDKTIKNPIKQVKGHIYRLNKLLKQNHVNYFINGFVIDVNEECSVSLSDVDEYADFFDSRILLNDNLFNYIQSKGNGHIISEREVNRINKVLKENIELK